ncbi:MAG: hypothetical protein IPM54_08405 [Polyangiaceae bacterium]|nr:hypothetical protein [Polyangiaceae bacterium]
MTIPSRKVVGTFCLAFVYAVRMATATRVFLAGVFSLVFAACGSPSGHSTVPDQPPFDRDADGTPVIVLGAPTPTMKPPGGAVMVAGDDPPVAVLQMAPPNADGDLAALVRDPRQSRWAPRPNASLVVEIQSLERLLAVTKPDAKDRPLILRRLAEDYVELKNAAIRGIELAQDPSRAQGEIAKLEKVAIAARHNAFKYYQELIHQHPKHCQTVHPTDPAQSRGCLDDVLYYYGLELEQAGKPDETRKHYLHLIQSFPQSPWAPYAYLGFGEFFFSEAQAQGNPNKWDFAQKTYEKVIQFPAPQNEALGFAHYRLAQIHDHKQDYPEALSHLHHAIEFSMKHAGLRSSARLGDAARRGIIPVYAAAGTPRKAEPVFKRLALDPPGTHDQLASMLDALVRTYMQENKPAEAAEVCQHFSGGASVLPSCRYVAPSAIRAAP